MGVDVKWRREAGVAVASVLGRIDNASADDFQSLVEDGLATDDDFLVVDMERVAFMTSGRPPGMPDPGQETRTREVRPLFADRIESGGRGHKRIRPVDPRTPIPGRCH